MNEFQEKIYDDCFKILTKHLEEYYPIEDLTIDKMTEAYSNVLDALIQVLTVYIYSQSKYIGISEDNILEFSETLRKEYINKVFKENMKILVKNT